MIGALDKPTVGWIASNLWVLSNEHIVYSGTPSDLRDEHHIGYSIKIDFIDPDSSSQSMESIFEFISSHIRNASLDLKRGNIVIIPMSDEMSSILEHFDNHPKDWNLSHYSLMNESIEDVILQILTGNVENSDSDYDN